MPTCHMPTPSVPASHVNATNIALQEGWAAEGTIVVCDPDVARDFGFSAEGPRWEARRLLTACIAAIRGYSARTIWTAMVPDSNGVDRKGNFVRFQHVVEARGYDEVTRRIQITHGPLPVPGLNRPGYVISYGDRGAWAEYADATLGRLRPESPVNR